MRSLLRPIVRRWDILNFGREIVRDWTRDHAPRNASKLRLLDVGVGSGADLLSSAQAVAPKQTELHGLDWRRESVAQLDPSIVSTVIDIEREVWPFDDGSFDVVISNQTLEHTKEIFWVCSEMFRVLRPGGLAIVGVPNLASLHNRVLLALGEQPSCIEVFGSHVRGMTIPSLGRFLTAGDFVRVERVAGSNFYPFPPAIAKPLAHMLPSLAVSIYFACRRTEKPGRFIDLLDSTYYTTRYFRGASG